MTKKMKATVDLESSSIGAKVTSGTRESVAMRSNNNDTSEEKVIHGGTIRVEGVNNEGELIAVVEHHISRKIGDDNRRIPDAPSIMPL